MTPRPERILSIQSHVAFGYVGGKAALFPLQCLGYDVDVINTVNFSNHPGYERFSGTITNADELRLILSSMEENELLAPSRLLTGYVLGAEALGVVSELARKLKARNPELIYLLDPLLGDEGKLYVNKDVIPVYLTILSLATVITPNWFEVETLTNRKLIGLNSLRLALKTLHEEYNVPNIVITSIPLRPWLADALPRDIRPSDGAEYLLCLCSSRNISEPNVSTVHAACIPLFPGHFVGVGDLFSALLLGHYHVPSESYTPPPSFTPLSHATTLALNKVHVILQSTHNHSQTLPEDERRGLDEGRDDADPVWRSRRMRGRELRLVQSQDIFRMVHLDYMILMRDWKTFWEISPRVPERLMLGYKL